jgi:cellobiose epimerase
MLQLALVALASGAGWSESDSLLQTDARLQLLLREGVLMRWFPAAIDTTYGGYRFTDAASQTHAGGPRKTLMGQAGAVWFLARMVASGQASREYLPVARHGFSFLAQKMRDRVFGGFFWEMDHTGRIGTKPHKQMLGQATALLAIAEYAAVSQDTMAARLARRLYETLDQKAWYATHGGYHK